VKTFHINLTCRGTEAEASACRLRFPAAAESLVTGEMRCNHMTIDNLRVAFPHRRPHISCTMQARAMQGKLLTGGLQSLMSEFGSCIAASRGLIRPPALFLCGRLIHVCITRGNEFQPCAASEACTIVDARARVLCHLPLVADGDSGLWHCRQGIPRRAATVRRAEDSICAWFRQRAWWGQQQFHVRMCAFPC
jgi:hypothetical protein